MNRRPEYLFKIERSGILQWSKRWLYPGRVGATTQEERPMAPRRPREQDAAYGGASRFPAELLYRAARLYYLEDATQAEIAHALGTSRPTVSRLLAEARATGIVRIEVREPEAIDTRVLADQLAAALGLARAWVAPSASGMPAGKVLAPGVREALRMADLHRGDALLVSSGASVHAVSQEDLPVLPGILLAPTVGGRDEPEEYYQTNEITRRMAVRMQGVAVLLYAPAMPGPALHELLMQDEAIQRVTTLWRSARAAVLGIGAPPTVRTSLPSMLPKHSEQLEGAVGDICSRPFDRSGHPIVFPGSERLVAMELDDLRQVPHAIGVAVGPAKIDGIVVAARAGYINELVTDSPTAGLLLDAAGSVTASRSA
jgi:DNA-binding transcriptional regulator LsrR (DeoR family)